MKRDNERIRDLILRFEEDEKWLHISMLHLSPSEDEEADYYHIQLLKDAGIVTDVGKGTVRLTNAGHDFAEALRDEGIWNRTKSAVAETGGNATLEIVKAIALGFLKKKISQHTDIEL